MDINSNAKPDIISKESSNDHQELIDLWNKLGELSIEFDNYYLSIKCFQYILKLTQLNFKTLVNLGKCCDKFETELTGFDNTIQAINYLEYYNSIEKNHEICYLLAKLYYNVKDYSKSLSLLDAESIDTFDGWYLRGLNYLLVGQIDDAESCIDRTKVTLVDEKFTSLHFLAKCKFKRQQWTKSETYLQQAVEFKKFDLNIMSFSSLF